MEIYPSGHRNSRCKICKAGLAHFFDFLHYFGYSYANIVEDYGDLVPNLNIVNLSNHYNAITPAGKAFWAGMVEDVQDFEEVEDLKKKAELTKSQFDRMVRLTREFYGVS